MVSRTSASSALTFFLGIISLVRRELLFTHFTVIGVGGRKSPLRNLKVWDVHHPTLRTNDYGYCHASEVAGWPCKILYRIGDQHPLSIGNRVTRSRGPIHPTSELDRPGRP